jgi:hypothetical protein
MEPQVRYCTTSDAVNIAYWTLGEGPPLIHLAFLASHIGLEWEYPETRSYGCEGDGCYHVSRAQ